MNPATACAQTIVDELVRGGVTEAVLAPGSRSAPLALALHAADAGRRIRLHVRIDERSAAFLALGLARGSGHPVPVVCTSGTAVANLHPATLEASQDGVPLLLLTADRPAELRGSDANQVIDQVDLFGAAVRWRHDLATPDGRRGQPAYWRASVCRALAAATDGARPGPVHLNLPFREPLLPDGDDSWPDPLDGRSGGRPWASTVSSSLSSPADQPITLGGRPLVVASVGAALPAWVCTGAVPVIAETAGAGHPDAVLTAGAWVVSDAAFVAAHRPDHVVCLGRPTLFRSVRRLLADQGVRVDVVSERATPIADGAATVRRRATTAVGDTEPGWTAAWVAADASAAAVVRGAVVAPRRDRAGHDGLRLAHDLVAAAPHGALLVVGSSQPVRDIGLAAPTRPDLQVVANRGVAGIDGTVSTAVGAALAAQSAHPGRPAVALMGDLTFLHDQNGLVLGPDEPRPDLTIVVANNDGGAIFALLEQGAPDFATSYERVFGTPHGVDLGAVCKATGTAYQRRFGSLGDALDGTTDVPGLHVIEVVTTRADVRAEHRSVADAVHGALQR